MNCPSAFRGLWYTQGDPQDCASYMRKGDYKPVFPQSGICLHSPTITEVQGAGAEQSGRPVMRPFVIWCPWTCGFVYLSDG